MVYTNVKFTISDPIWQKVYDAAEEKARLNVLAFCSRPVLIEGGGYNGIWLETQPMGGEMYAMRNMEAAMNNQLFFMENIRADGRIPSVIRFTGDEKHPLDLMFSHFQGYCFPYHALNMYFLNGHDREYLEMLYDVLERFDAYLWKHRDSDGDGCLESWCGLHVGHAFERGQVRPLQAEARHRRMRRAHVGEPLQLLGTGVLLSAADAAAREQHGGAHAQRH